MRFISLEPGRYNAKPFKRAGLKGDVGVFYTDDPEVIKMLKSTPWFKKGIIRAEEEPVKKSAVTEHSRSAGNSEFLELRKQAKELGIKGYAKLKKKELKDAIDNASKPSE